MLFSVNFWCPCGLDQILLTIKEAFPMISSQFSILYLLYLLTMVRKYSSDSKFQLLQVYMF